jgi:hypothetical protein
LKGKQQIALVPETVKVVGEYEKGQKWRDKNGQDDGALLMTQTSTANCTPAAAAVASEWYTVENTTACCFDSAKFEFSKGQ